MSWKNIRLIFLREMRDQLRDRRTLFMVAVLPVLLYPAMVIGTLQMNTLFREQPRTVVILGAEHLPHEPKLLEGNRFAERWFRPPEEPGKLVVIADNAVLVDGASPEAESRAELLDQCRLIRDRAVRLAENDAAFERARNADDRAETERLANRSNELRDQLGKLFAAIEVQVLIDVPDGFAENIERLNRQIAERSLQNQEIAEYPRPTIIENSADDKSSIAYRRTTEVLGSWEQQILERRLQTAGLPASLPAPVRPKSVDLAKRDQLSANLWSKLVPTLAVIMAITGAFYPAVDLVAGEKERGTMETLLISPAKRSEIVLGKFLTVLLFSLSTTVLNLVSLGFTGWFVASGAVTGTLSRVGVITFPGPLAIVWILLLLAPLAAFFSALSLALATFARSSKEGHYYLYPLLMVTLGLTIFCLSPAVEIEPFFSVMPVVGVALLLKELLASPGSTQPLVYVIPVLTASIAYSLLALWWAIDQFKREEVLFREAERFELRLWIRHLLRDKEPLPSFSEAVVCFILIMFLQFASIRFFQRAIYASPDSALSGLMLKLLIVQQLVIIASPALLMGLLLTASFRRTFRFRWPRWQMLGVAAALPLALHPLTVELAAGLEWFFPELPQEIHDVVALMSDQSRPVWLVLLVFAAAPALCEEFAFRGFILSGFSRTGRVWLAIFFSSAMFGIMHMIPQQVFNATLLGLVLGLIAVRSKSLLPCMLFHFLYNATEILRGRVDPDWFQETPAEWFVTVKSFEGQQILHYGWPTLVVATIVVVVLLRWLIGHSAREAVPPTIVSTPVDAHPLSY